VAYLEGRKVAVKVRHPNVADQIDLDFRLMKRLAEVIVEIYIWCTTVEGNMSMGKFHDFSCAKEVFSHRSFFGCSLSTKVTDAVPSLRFLNLKHSMDQFSHTLASQTRLDIEGVHLLIMNRNFRRWGNVRFPEPIFLHEAVLVESFEEGSTISEYIERYSKWRTEQGDCDVSCSTCPKAWVNRIVRL
jgi:predicted unusual protein kinase regulating ubiquinone biosynthesis (AarF/ABC1/UbiB family)